MPQTELASPLCVELHDVAPATWAECARILDVIDSIGRIPVTLLVVPDYHRRGSIVAEPSFRAAIDARLHRGDEIALHGYSHLDEGPPPTRGREWIQRRVLTQSEGEFAAIDAATARERLERGLAAMRASGWAVRGFVPPAWLLSAGARIALGDFGFAYTETRGGLYTLPGWELDRTVTLAYSPRSAWRRLMSDALIGLQCSTLRRRSTRRTMRIAIHPADARFRNVMDRWRTIIERAVATRVPMTTTGSLALAPAQ